MDAPAGQRLDARPRCRGLRRSFTGRLHARAEFLAVELLRELLGPGDQLEIRRAERDRHDALVMDQLREQSTELPGLLVLKLREDREPRAAHGQLGTQREVLLEPVGHASLHDDGCHPGHQGESENQGEHEAGRTDHRGQSST